MGKQSRLRSIRRGLRKAVKMEHVSAQWANDSYREAKGREAPAPGPMETNRAKAAVAKVEASGY